jgi:alpha-1,6-mannosyltransferase
MARPQGLRYVKTLHLTNAWHDTSGGVSVFYRALLAAAEREGHFMRLVVPGDRTSIEECGRFGRIYRIEAPRAPLNRDYRIIYPHRYLLPGTALQRILNDEKPDLVEASEKYTMLYFTGLLRTGRLPGVKLRPTTIGMSHERMDENMAAYLTHGSFGQRFARWYMKWLYFPSFDHHVTVSEHTAAELIAASHGHKITRGIWVSPMGVDCERFTPQRRSPEGREDLRRITGGSADSTVLLYAGRLAPEKNLPLLLDVMSLLEPDHYRLAIAGEGMMRETLEAICRQRGIRNVVFPGHIADRDRLADHYANADIFVHPNPREPFGIAPLEAMAAGLPLVAPNSGGVSSYAGESNAWLTAPTPEAFVRAIREIRSHPEEARRRTLAARQTAESHGWFSIATQYLRLYQELDGITKNARTRPVAARSIQPRAWSTPARSHE